MIEDKKILILSVSPWNSKVGADTWPTLVSGLNPDNIASISLREEAPDSPNCNNYFVLSENRVLKSIFKRGIKTGRRVERENDTISDSDLQAHNLRYQKLGKKRSVLSLIAREMVWKLGKWKSKELDDFINDFAPDVLLYSMDGYIHFNRICKYAKKKTNAKSIGFFCDDNFTFKQPQRFSSKIFRIFQRRSLKKLAGKTDGFWAITDMTKKEADETFGINCTVITKPINRETVYKDWQVGEPISVLYTGNLQIGRDNSLVKVVNALKEVNREKTHFTVDVYTKTVLSDNILKELDCDFCKIHAPIPQSEVLALQEESDILLFLEDIDGINSKIARLSFSTKITDYLSSGKSIFAVGRLDTAPMQYFINNDIAVVAETKEEMIAKFKAIIDNPNILCEYAKRSSECGIKYHKKENILKLVHDSIEQL